MNGLYKVIDNDEPLQQDSTFLDEEILSGQVFRFHQDEDEDVWFRVQRKIKLFKKNYDNKYWKSEVTLPEITKSDIIFNITSYENLVWFAGYDKIFELDKTKLSGYDTSFKTNITEVFINRDSLIYAGFGEANNKPILSYKDNELRFAFSAASYKSPDLNQFQVFLEGFDRNWSPWSLETQKDYTNIPEGDYTFKVKSQNVYGAEGSIDEFYFTILPP